MRAYAQAGKRKKKIPLVLRGQKKWVVRLFNSRRCNGGSDARTLKAISGYRGIVWQCEAICRHSMQGLKNKANVDLKFPICESSSFIVHFPVGRKQ
ncbi:hypothetical protein PSAB6_390126 [Paraburkholderia sabiae]|jgi:hypothetical protein|nr:hypothetical protein PSAB6_390126 [Paraburkholderia sabiae]